MRVKMLRLMCHPELGNVHPGQEVDLPREEAEKRIAAGYCVPAEEPQRDLVDKLRRRKDDDRREDGGQAVKPIDKMIVPELQKYAADRGIDLGDATLKRDILAAIEAAQDADE